MTDKIKEALGEWIKPRTIFSFMFYTTFLNLILSGLPIPPALNTIISTLFGYWFGSRTTKGGNQ